MNFCEIILLPQFVMKFTAVIRYVALSLLMVGAVMAISAGISLSQGRDEGFIPLAYSAFITLICALFPLIFIRGGKKINKKEANLIVVLAWAAACLFGTVPYLMYGGSFNFVNALFECVSGFTTTGASILADVESLPVSLKFWRISTAWVGGFGIVTLFSMLIPSGKNNILWGTELSKLTKEQYNYSGKGLISIMLGVYSAITLLGVISLKLTGIDWFDAVTNAMSAASTCGFSIRNTSIAAYCNPAAEIIISFLMLLSGTSFLLIFSLFTGIKSEAHSHRDVPLAYLSLILLCTLAIFFNLMHSHSCTSMEEGLRKAFFQVCSITTTTGFATDDTSLWPPLSTFILILCSLVCGCSGSTSGGIKTDRAVLLAKDCQSRLLRLRKPNAISVVRFNGRIASGDEIHDAAIFIMLYLIIIVLGALAYSATGTDFLSSLSASVACTGNVGPGFGIIGSMGNYADFSVFSKYICILQMLAGRLEIIPLLLVAGYLKK